jgi:hypothetical protein
MGWHANGSMAAPPHQVIQNYHYHQTSSKGHQDQLISWTEAANPCGNQFPNGDFIDDGAIGG